MRFDVGWPTLVEEVDALSAGATLVTPLSHHEFRITGVQRHRVFVEDIVGVLGAVALVFEEIGDFRF